MIAAADWFERTFGVVPPVSLAEVVAQPLGESYWSSLHDARLAPDALVTTANLEGLPDCTVIGHWGYGIGSQAFYFVRCEGLHRCFLRVAFGGAYDDDPRQAEEIVTALEAYRGLREHAALAASEIVYSMRTGHARLEREGHAPLELDIWQASAGVVGAPAPRVGEFMQFIRCRVQSL